MFNPKSCNDNWKECKFFKDCGLTCKCKKCSLWTKMFGYDHCPKAEEYKFNAYIEITREIKKQEYNERQIKAHGFELLEEIATNVRQIKDMLENKNNSQCEEKESKNA